MEQYLEEIVVALQRDTFDYWSVVAPILISVVAIVITIWSNFWSKNYKSLDALLVWDDLFNTFFVLIVNDGNKTLVIDTVSLVAYKLGQKTEYELGSRKNTWASQNGKVHLSPGEAMRINPTYGSIYDVFAYRGHCWGVTKENENLKVRVIVTDIKKKKWVKKTSFTLKEIEEKLEYAVTMD